MTYRSTFRAGAQARLASLTSKFRPTAVLPLAFALVTVALLTSLAPASSAAEEVNILRDDFGIPHIYARSLEGAAYAAGYAQAEDRLEQLLQNYRLAAGTLSEVAGPEFVQYDYRSRVWQHEAICRSQFDQLDPKIQAVCRAYVRGIQHYMAQHPDQVPAWAQPLEAYHPVMLSRFIIWGWPEGQAADDLKAAGIRPDPVGYRGSNEWLIAPERTTLGVPIALVDPHLSWYGPFRFYEIRLYASDEDFAVSGAAILGVPLPGLGHSQHVSIAMTTGGPDTSDVYEVTLHPDDPTQYQMDGQWREMSMRTEVIRVRMGEEIVDREIRIASTRHGPVLARDGDKGYAFAIPYTEQVGLMDELYRVMTARNLAEVKQALATLQLMPQNVMIGTVDGDIYYVRTGRVPIRNHGLPTDRPVPGDDSRNDFAGIHPFEDLVQLENPPAGYMQNCNIAPLHLLKDSPLTPERFAKVPYLYNADSGPAHQRAAAVLELLDTNAQFTLDDAMELAFSCFVLGADRWQARIAAATANLLANGGGRGDDFDQICRQIGRWDGRSTPDSTGALSYYLFKRALGEETAAAVDVPEGLSDEAIVEAIEATVTALRSRFGRLDAQYGELFRVGREGSLRTYPVGGGTVREAGMSTPRAISFSPQGEQLVGRGGQTATQVIVLSRPPRSYMVLPLGQSDHRDSPHWDDQAERLFSSGQAKDTFFLDRAGLEPHVTSTTVLEY